MNRTVHPIVNDSFWNTIVEEEQEDSGEVFIKTPSDIIENNELDYDYDYDNDNHNGIATIIPTFSVKNNRCNEVVVQKNTCSKRWYSNFICRLFCCC
jgi:hypothetical protein